jgi:pyruvate kinase
MVDLAETLLEQGGFVRSREVIAIVAGTRTKSGSTNFLRLHVLGDRIPAGRLPSGHAGDASEEGARKRTHPKAAKPDHRKQ